MSEQVGVGPSDHLIGWSFLNWSSLLWRPQSQFLKARLDKRSSLSCWSSECLFHYDSATHWHLFMWLMYISLEKKCNVWVCIHSRLIPGGMLEALFELIILLMFSLHWIWCSSTWCHNLLEPVSSTASVSIFILFLNHLCRVCFW